MNILLITNTAASIFNFRLRLIERLIHDGHIVYLLLPKTDASRISELNQLGIHVVFYELNRSSVNPFQAVVTICSMIKKIKEINPDITFSFFSKSVIFGTLAAHYAGVKCNYSMLEGLGYCFTRRLEPDSLKKKILRRSQVLLYKLALPHSRCVIFLNDDDRREIIIDNNVRVKCTYVIGGIGVDLNKFSYQPLPREIRFTMVSRLLIDKGVREYIKAANYVREIYSNVKFDFVGGIDDNLGGVSKTELKSWIDEGHVNFRGVSNNIHEVLTETSVFVLPSYREGVPRSTQEAMAIGRPIITTNVPGCKETVIDGVNGFLVPPWNAQALAEKMIYFIENQSEIERMGKESRILAERKFDEDVFCDKLIKILLG